MNDNSTTPKPPPPSQLVNDLEAIRDTLDEQPQPHPVNVKHQKSGREEAEASLDLFDLPVLTEVVQPSELRPGNDHAKAIDVWPESLDTQEEKLRPALKKAAEEIILSHATDLPPSRDEPADLNPQTLREMTQSIVRQLLDEYTPVLQKELAIRLKRQVQQLLRDSH